MNHQVKEIMCDILENRIDSLMEQHDFQRRGKSLNYYRKINSTKQRIEMVAYSHPSYYPGSLMHIYPFFSIYFPEINEMADKIIDDAALVPKLDKQTIRQPVQLIRKCDPWIVFQQSECDSVAQQIYYFFKNDVIPLLNHLQTISDFIKIYESKDNRIILCDTKYLFLISAYVVQGNYEKAKKVLEERFGKPGSRKQYKCLFSYFEIEGEKIY